MDVKLQERFAKIAHHWDGLHQQKSQWESTLDTAQERMQKVLHEQDVIVKSLNVLKQVRPLLSLSSIKDCEALANSALKTVFDSDSRVEWSVEDEQFMLRHADGFTTSLTSEGGGYLTVISFVFQVYLIIKMGKRRFICLDEFFTCISDAYLENFLVFLRQLCKDLDFTVLLITHDSRIDVEDVDHLYEIQKGHSKRIK